MTTIIIRIMTIMRIIIMRMVLIIMLIQNIHTQQVSTPHALSCRRHGGGFVAPGLLTALELTTALSTSCVLFVAPGRLTALQLSPGLSTALRLYF